MAATSYADLFVQQVHGIGAEEEQARTWIRTALTAIGTTWPELPPPDAAFVSHVAASVGPHGWDDLQPADMYLAWTCSHGVDVALRTFEARYGGLLDACAHSFGAKAGRDDDLRQLLRTHLLAPRPDAPPRIAEYRGTGPLEGWIRVSATRRLVDETRRVKRREREELRDDDWLERQCREDQVELAFLQARYRDAFRRAFAAAASTLSPEQRNYLRYQTRDGLTLDQIAELHGQHRSSVDRRIRTARRQLLDETRRALAQELNAGPAEVDSVLRLIQSQLDASVSRLLRA